MNVTFSCGHGSGEFPDWLPASQQVRECSACREKRYASLQAARLKAAQSILTAPEAHFWRPEHGEERLLASLPEAVIDGEYAAGYEFDFVADSAELTAITDWQPKAAFLGPPVPVGEPLPRLPHPLWQDAKWR